MGRFFEAAEARNQRIPWFVRETCAKQIASAVAEVHKRGFVIGALRYDLIGIDGSGDAVPTTLRTSVSRIRQQAGFVSPQLRGHRSKSSLQNTLTFRTDVFQLGIISWSPGEHKPNLSGHFCARHSCKSSPRHSCKIGHRDPVHISPCSDGDVPEYFDGNIAGLRQENLLLRTITQAAVDCFPLIEKPPQVAVLQNRYPIATRPRFIVHCSECGSYTTEMDYHCDICDSADCDLCGQCKARNIHSHVQEHQMVRRIFKNDTITIDGKHEASKL